MKRAARLVPILVLLPLLVFATEIPLTFAWDPNPTAEAVTGYLLSYGSVPRTDPTFTAYATTIDCGKVTTWTLPAGALTVGKVWYVAVRAYNSGGIKSDFSDELLVDLRKPSKPTGLNRVTVVVNPDGTVTVSVL